MSRPASSKQTDAPKAKKQQAAKTSSTTQEATNVDRKSGESASGSAKILSLTTTQRAHDVSQEARKIIAQELQEFKENDLYDKDVYVVATGQGLLPHWGIVVGVLYFHVQAEANEKILIFKVSKWDTTRSAPKKEDSLGKTSSTYKDIFNTLWTYTFDGYKQYQGVFNNCQDWVKGALTNLGFQTEWKPTVDKAMDVAAAITAVVGVILIINVVYEIKKEIEKK